MEIEVINPIWSRFKPKEDIEKILPCLRYKKEFWRPGAFRKMKSDEEHFMINLASGKFRTGLIPRIENFCKAKGWRLKETLAEIYPAEKEIPSLPGFTFREDQIEAVKSVISNQRGIFKNATGTGKTVLAGAICSIWQSAHRVFLCHTLDLLNQAYVAFTKQFGFDNVIVLGGGKNKFDWPKEPTIIISTVQTFIGQKLNGNSGWIDIIILDECHHLTAKSSLMARILEQIDAPIRIGLSAELPKTEEGKLILEGFVGPVIGEFKYAEAVKAGVLAKPLFNLIPVPYSDEIGSTPNYNNKYDDNKNFIKGMYQKGIIENRARNRLALAEAIKSVDQGDSVLILTARDTNHGKILSEMAREVFDIEIPFVYGETEKEQRYKFQQMLESKEIKCIISNVVWKEGINIKSLNHVINVGGEKSPTQIVGRGSRVTETKKWVKITDFLDPYRFLSHHTVQRLIVYANEGWLNFHDMKGEKK